jgi:hypothetical protein
MLHPNSHKLCQQVQAVGEAETLLKLGSGAETEINRFGSATMIKGHSFFLSPTVLCLPLIDS